MKILTIAVVLSVAVSVIAGASRAMVPVPNGNDPGPCVLTVYWDERVSGCDEIADGSSRDSLLAAAVDNAQTVMRAWRKRQSSLIVPRRRWASDTVGTALQLEMQRTLEVDSMAVSIASDSIAADVALLHTRTWLARTVQGDQGRPQQQVERVDYSETWRHRDGRWWLEKFDQDSSDAWFLGRVPAATPFPSIPGVSMSPGAIAERNLEERVGVTPCDAEDDGREIKREAFPVTTVQPNYPEFAREAQIQGKVVLRACVNRAGRVQYVIVFKGVTGLNDAAMDAVRQWQFAPAIDRDGKAVGSWVTVPVDFHL